MELFVDILNGLLFAQYKLHHRCSTGLYIGLWKYWNFQREAKVEQIIAIVATRSVSCYIFFSNLHILYLTTAQERAHNLSKQNPKQHETRSLFKSVYENICILHVQMSDISSTVTSVVGQTLDGGMIMFCYFFVSVWEYFQKHIKTKAIWESNIDYKRKHQNFK